MNSSDEAPIRRRGQVDHIEGQIVAYHAGCENLEAQVLAYLTYGHGVSHALSPQSLGLRMD